jgi:spermidine dehydrogenase
MSRKITRRDFVNGVSAGAAGAMLLAQQAVAQEFAPEQSPDYYPPALTGMRGDHPGSFEVAHQLRDSRKADLSAVAHTNETYDLVIVGGGISGLGAAYYFLKNAGRTARVLILDNHDDFGGHAKRNEFRHNGRLVAINGGTLNIEAPRRYNESAKELLFSIGIDLDRFQSENARQSQSLSFARIGPRTLF